ncbi:hypothetical protein H4R34_001354 [Dimargaris verticillata]|uniref:Uncharacterized protein n=1 Tax=Dimargaris verticillata TaxID=2761393 RepID=A0A9W8EEK3_9FUNG|nr:hypothetical protein H4R34_001354 [Dimargaris verticillata]
MYRKALAHRASDCARTLWRHSRYRRLVYFVLMLVGWCVLVPPMYLVFLHEGGRSDTIAQYSQRPEAQDYVDVTLIAQSANLDKHQLSAYVEVVPNGKYALANGEAALGLVGYFGDTVVQFTKNRRMQAFDLAINLDGSPHLFPFDTHEGETSVLVIRNGDDRASTNDTSTAEEDAVRGTETTEFVPVHLTFFGSVQSLNFEAKLTTSASDPVSIRIQVNIERTALTLAFSIIVMVFMWGLALAQSTLAFQVLFSNRQAGPGILVFGITSIFSLPALRAAQPGIPNMGCASDALCFFW